MEANVIKKAINLLIQIFICINIIYDTNINMNSNYDTKIRVPDVGAIGTLMAIMIGQKYSKNLSILVR